MRPAPLISLCDLEPYSLEMREVIIHYGLEVFQFSNMVAGCNMAIDVVVERSQRDVCLRTPSLIILNNFSSIIDEVIKSRGWEANIVLNCLGDIRRAHEAEDLAKVTRVIH